MSDGARGRHIALNGTEPLTDENTVGVVDDIDPALHMVEFTAARHTITARLNDGIGDEDSRLFVGSDGGDLKVTYEPQFDAPIVTNFRKWEASLVFETFREEVGHGAVDVLFDDAGPTVFRCNGMLIAVAPAVFPWHQESQPQQPHAPRGPSVGGDGA